MKKYKKAALPQLLKERYQELKDKIRERLKEYASVPEDKYFYELCYCLMTPQSRARSAYEAQLKLEALDFERNEIDLIPILRNPEHYIRFHNQKALRLKEAKVKFPIVLELLRTNLEPQIKRMLINHEVNGLGMKESAHFLRNIGYRDLGILDRHILKHLVKCGIYDEVPKIGGVKQYQAVEKEFAAFADYIGIPMDELDLLFWSWETGEIFK